MGRPGTRLALLAAVAALGAGVFSWRRREARRRVVTLAAERLSYLHYDLVGLRLTESDPALEREFAASPPRVAVLRGGVPVTTVGGIRETTLRRAAPGVWAAKWPVPWNAPAGEYLPALVGRGDLAGRLRAAPFRVARRVPAPLPRPFVVATLEETGALSGLRLRGPDGRVEDWRALLDWTQALGANALLVLAGRSPGRRPGQVWDDSNAEFLPVLARACRRRGILFGAYAMYSLTTSTRPVGGYEYAQGVRDGRPVPTRAISLRDRRRADDVVRLLKPLAADPDVSFVGLDYIRNALGGDELASDFVAEMPGVPAPPEWPRLSRAEREVWLARKIAMHEDAAFLDAWDWWRARRAALLVREIKSRLGGTKPLWAFTLTWDRGWQHGQDPVMMNDAGVDYDGLMFYQADKAQYAAMMRDWRGYAARGDVQLVPGDIFDWDLHQKDPAGPAEFGRRLRLAVDSVYRDGPARAVFFHDLSRLLWRGRLGRWGALGWAAQARELSRYVQTPVPERTR